MKTKKENPKAFAVGKPQESKLYIVDYTREDGTQLKVRVVMTDTPSETIFITDGGKRNVIDAVEQTEIENAVLWSIKNSRVSPFSFPIPESVRLGTPSHLGGR